MFKLFRDLHINWIMIFRTLCKHGQRFTCRLIFKFFPVYWILFNRAELLWINTQVSKFTFLRRRLLEHSGFSSFAHLTGFLQMFCELTNSVLFNIISFSLFVLQLVFNVWVLLGGEHFAILNWFINKFWHFMLFYSGAG